MAYEESAQFYDLLYGWKDYEKEAAEIADLLARFSCPPGASILDVACGTGKHGAILSDRYTVSGVDIEPQMVEIASQRLNGICVVGNMLDLKLDQKFDAVMCLFSSIGYMPTEEALFEAIAEMSRHLKPAGVLMVEAWFEPDDFHHGHVSHLYQEIGDTKVDRMGYSTVENGVAIMHMHHLIGTKNSGVRYFAESHRMTLFTDSQYRAAFEKAGLNVEKIDNVLTRRGLYVGHLDT